MLKPRADFYRHEHPTGTDTLLLIEVSDSTLRYDRDVKVPLYARHGVPEVWIVDLQHGRMLFYASLADGEYRKQSSVDRPGVTPLAALPGVSVDLSGVLEP
jgi:Uma2 family endonuclease